MKIKIIKWSPMSWHWLNKTDLEGKELEVLDVIESKSRKGKISYLIKEPNRYVQAKDCVVVSE